MKYSTVLIDIDSPFSEDGYVFDAGSLYDALLKLADKHHTRGKRQVLALVLYLLAKLAY